jgi:hypothetical protein
VVTHIRESRRFEYIYNLHRKPGQHAIRIPHSGLRMTTFHVAINRVGQILCSREISSPNATPSPAKWFADLALFLSSTSQWSRWGKINYPLTTGNIGLLGTYLQHAISTFNTCSQVTTHRSLTDTSGNYNLQGAGFSHHSPRPYQSMVLWFPLRASPDLRLTIFIMKLQ